MEKGKFMEFNERLRYLIDCEEIKIKDLAPKLCLSASTLSNYTQGIREPDYDTLRRIADYFGVSIDYLLGHKSPVTDDERQLLALFRSFTPSQRRLLLEQAELLTHYKIKLDD
jgi:transcriptional regulator with XRE-family HTH domain